MLTCRQRGTRIDGVARCRTVSLALAQPLRAGGAALWRQRATHRLPPSLAVDARLAALSAKTQACVADIRAELASQLALLSTQARAPHQELYVSVLTRWLPLWC